MTVVVGVKAGSSTAAIRLARTEADYRKVPLVAVMAHGTDSALGTPGGRPLSMPPSEADRHEAAESTLRQAVTEALGDQAAGVQLLVIAGTASSVLVQAARKLDADLVVLSRRPVHSPAWLLGEVSQHVLRNAPCPVLIVPETDS